MKEFNRNEKGDKKLSEIEIFPVPFSLRETKELIFHNTAFTPKRSQEQIINQAISLHLNGNISEAKKYYQDCLNKGFNDPRVFSNYGTILKDLGKFKEAESLFRKAIELKPDFAEAYSNIGSIFRDIGNLQKAEISQRKAIELKPDFAEAHLNLGNILKELGKPQEAELSMLKAIELKPGFAEAHSNLGTILMDLNKPQDAEKPLLKAIELKPNFANAYCNLGAVLKNLGKLKEAEISTRKAIEINPNLAKAYYTLSEINQSNKNTEWQARLFSQSILKNQIKRDLVDIYFARANILEQNSDFLQAGNLFKKANNLNRDIYDSDYKELRIRINNLNQNLQGNDINLNQPKNLPIPIFVVGLPRSGKTLIESILACNNKLIKGGENNSLKNAIQRLSMEKENSINQNLYKLYIENLDIDYFGKSFICTTTSMNLLYTEHIIREMPQAKIIYCFRNPLDNIIEIYKKNLGNKQSYSSSIVESANIWIDLYSLMEKYKKIYSSKIYFINYDNLVTNTDQEIKNLLCWLGWEIDNKYLEPDIDPTTTDVSSKLNSKKINSNQLSSWENYEDLLQPAIKIFNNSTKFKRFIRS